MRKEIGLALALLAMLPTPALAGGAGPSVTSTWGIIIIIIAVIVGFVLCRFTRK